MSLMEKVKEELKYIFEIPCLKQTIFYSIFGASASSIGYFLITSNRRKMNTIFMVSFGTIYFGFFSFCRINEFKKAKLLTIKDKCSQF
ncbi:unnamed protein product [Gordionus sp. m RMFG-2023]